LSTDPREVLWPVGGISYARVEIEGGKHTFIPNRPVKNESGSCEASECTMRVEGWDKPTKMIVTIVKIIMAQPCLTVS